MIQYKYQVIGLYPRGKDYKMKSIIKRIAVIMVLAMLTGCSYGEKRDSGSEIKIPDIISSSTHSTIPEVSSSLPTSSEQSSTESSSNPESSSQSPVSSEFPNSTSSEISPEPISSSSQPAPIISSSSTESESSSSSAIIVPPEPIISDDPIQSRIAQMTLEERVYQLFFVNPEQITGGGTVLIPLDLSNKPVGGIICMGDNLESVRQTREMLSKTQESALSNGVGVFFGVDEEGGGVARCAKKLGTTAFSNMASYGARNDSNEAFYIGKTIGSDIRALGFNVDFAPVADVDIHPNNELGSRIFSDDPQVVANMTAGVVRGLNSSGVAATLKHFPGLGAEDGNTHTDSFIVIDRTLEQLRAEEFVPFREGIRAGADFVMVGHQQVTSFGDNLPADLSYTAVTTMLRGELGFTGIAITDAQRMNTISTVYDSGMAAVLSIKAGIDMILSPADFNAAYKGVLNAVKSGEISEQRINESVTRILTVKYKMGILPTP